MDVIIPVEWSVYSTIVVENAKSIKDAREILERHIDELPLPTETEYVEDTFRISADTEEELENAQFYRTIGYCIKENPNGTIDIE